MTISTQTVATVQSAFVANIPSDIAAFNASLIAEFDAHVKHEVAVATQRKYQFHLVEFSAWLAHPDAMRADRSQSLVDVAVSDVQRFMGYLKAGHRFAATERCRVHVLSATARKNFHASLHTFYRYLMSVEMVVANPVAAVDTPKVVHRPGLTLTLDELRLLLNAPGSPRDRIQTFLMALTGARVGELRGLRWKDVDFGSQTMLLHGKNDTYRMLDIHPRLMGELRMWYVHQTRDAERNEAVARAKGDPETDFVLLSRNGRQVAQTTLMKQLKVRAARVGLHVTGDEQNPSRVHPHALRRTLATMLLNDGHHLDAVADILGHKETSTTRKHYAFSSNERRRATILAVNI